MGLNTQYDSMYQESSQNFSARYPGAYSSYTYAMNQKVNTNYLFIEDPSLGYVIDNNFLIYALGGYAMTDISYNQTFTENLANAYESSCINRTAPGWSVGGGFEWKFSPNHWAFDTEYLYTDFGSSKATSNNFTAQGAAAGYSNTFYNNLTFNSSVIFFGINYIF